MIGVVIVTHGRLAHEFRAALEHVVGPQEHLETISIGPDDDLQHKRGRSSQIQRSQRLEQMVLRQNAVVEGHRRIIHQACPQVVGDSERRADMLSALARVDNGGGVVVLTDMFGGTPSNLAISAMERDNVEVIAGVNLPMLVKLASVRGECGLEEAVNQAQEAGRKYISVASQILATN